MLFFPVATAYADGGLAGLGSAPGMSQVMSMAPLVLLFVIFYFLLIRPQQKRAKEHKQMLSEVKSGDTIITNGGLHGKVTEVSEGILTVEISPNVKVKVSKDAINMRKS